MKIRKNYIAYSLRWITHHVSRLWGLRIVKRLPSFMTAIEAEVTYRGLRFQIFTGEMLGFRLFYIGEYEPLQEDLFLALIATGDHVFDIGANIGIFSLLAAARGAQVTAFEPSKKLFSVLLANIERNHLSGKVTLVEQAVADKAGTVTFYETRPGNWGVGRIFEYKGKGKTNLISRETYQIPTNTLDFFVSQYGLPNVVKMDIEGAEWLVLQGGRQILEEQNAPHFLIEFHPGEIEQLGGSVGACKALFRKHGFRSFQHVRLRSEQGHQWFLFTKHNLSKHVEEIAVEVD